MILTIDVGNTRVKAAVFEQDNFLEGFFFQAKDFKKKIENILISYPKTTILVIASVGKIQKNEIEYFKNKLSVCFIDRQSQYPFVNNYQTPETLGIDRMVLAAGAVLQYPNANRLIIDAGTCVTYDFVAADNIYQGGAISPGTKLRYQAMHNFTANLPLLTLENPVNLIGTTTNSALHSGVVNGLVFEINGYINALERLNKNFIIILTGGDAYFLAKRLKNTIFANPNFLLESLYKLYQYQHNNG